MPGQMDRSAYDLLPLTTAAPSRSSTPDKQAQHSSIERESTPPPQQIPRSSKWLKIDRDSIPPPQRKPHNLVWHWRWEISTFCLGTAAFVAIVALLFNFRNKPAPNMPLGDKRLQLTTIVAALAQVAQSALLVPISYCIGQLKWKWFQRSNRVVDLDRFDLASRGPDGSMRLLWHFSWRQRLVSLGALATILMLVFPTFVQQSIQQGTIRRVDVNDGENAVMLRTLDVLAVIEEQLKVIKVAGENGTTSSVTLDESWSPTFGTSSSAQYMFCSDSNDGKCEWPAFNTLDLCLHTSDVSNHVEKSGDYVTLPELREFLPKDQDPPAFVSGARVYVAEARNATGMPTTSAGDGTNLPSLATIYFLYYDSCRGDKQGFDKKDPGRWTALKGDFQMCVQKYKLETHDRTAISPPIKPTTSTTSLWWNKTTKEDTPAYCTNVDEDEFCVGEPVMDKLASKMSRAFNATADFSVENRFDIVYSAQWVPKLTNTAFGGSDDIKPLECHAEQSGSGWQSGGQHADPFSGGGEFEFRVLLEGIADSLSLAFRNPYNDIVTNPGSPAFERQKLNGTHSWDQEVMVVDFRWFILPAVLYAIILIFFLATMVTTRKETPIWKSSPLPLLHAMRGDGSVESLRAFKEEHVNTRMRLGRTALGWRLVQEEVERKKENPDE